MPDISREIIGSRGGRSGKYGLQLKGLKELSRQLARDGEVWKRVQQAAVEGMIENTEDLLSKAMRDAPIDEGTLRASGSAVVLANGKPVARRGTQAFKAEMGATVGEGRLPEMAEQGVEIGHRVTERTAVAEGHLGDAVVGQVGFNAPYALVQHERLDFHHPKGGKAKYLEDNVKGQADAYQRNLNKHLQGALAEP